MQGEEAHFIKYNVAEEKDVKNLINKTVNRLVNYIGFIITQE